MRVDGKQLEARRVFICADCGTVASTNSGKAIVGDAPDLTEDTDHDLHGRLASDGVEMSPPCPCGCQYFNVDEHVAVHYQDETGIADSFLGAVEAFHDE